MNGTWMKGLRRSWTKRDDTENVQSVLNGRAAALHLRVEGFFIGGKKRGSVIG